MFENIAQPSHQPFRSDIYVGEAIFQELLCRHLAQESFNNLYSRKFMLARF